MMDIEQNSFLGLNAVATFIWDRLASAHSAEEIAAAETEMLRDLLLYVLAMGAEAELVGLAQVPPAAALARPAAADLSRLGIVTNATTGVATPARALQLAAL